MTELLASLLAYNDVGLFVLRCAVAVIFIVHATPKLKNPGAMDGLLGIKYFGAFIGLVELTGAVCLILGVLPQVAAMALSLVMLGAIYFKMSKWHLGFKAENATGWEFDFLILASCIAIIFTGGGTIGI